MEKLSNPQKTIEVIKKYDFAFQKKFGQNFLIDAHVLNDDTVSGGGGRKSCGSGDRPQSDPDPLRDAGRV